MHLTDPLAEVRWVADPAVATEVRWSVATRWLRSPHTWLTPTCIPVVIAVIAFVREGGSAAADAYAFALLLSLVLVPFIWLEPLLKREAPQGICAPPGTPMVAHYHYFSLHVHSSSKHWRIAFAEVHQVALQGNTVLLTGARDSVLPAGLVPPELVDFVRSRARR
ncbi:hypothetical protein JK358_37245 [Nocardia sp. 2]|uniref:Uncharacterized protein n=1 Tax=Nocardia acididurans TaxID=2802282 RepID=A0ABS1MHB7_9NOCA|nr:hypothetical protein [Nocardia acididurans]MBL1080058.1 hypothetical protein [Nocardia acididurans]